MNPPRSESPPDFTFPPKSRYAILKTASPQFPAPPPQSPTQEPTPTPAPAPAPRPKVPQAHTPPNFGFKFFPNPTPSPSPSPPPAAAVASPPAMTTLKPQPGAENKPSPLLAIPLEIRLQIYAHVLRAQKLHHAHLAPLPNDQPTTFSGVSTSEFHTTLLRPAHISHPSVRPLISCFLVTSTSSSSSSSPKTTEHVLPPTRTHTPHLLGKIPTSLLTSCRQIHAETHRLPFERNTFCFVNWWWSGLFCAARFTRGLRSWQVEALRSVRLETLARDLGRGRDGGRDGQGQREGLVGKGGGLEAFVQVCESWTGVRTLWMRLKGAVAVEGVGREEGREESEGVGIGESQNESGNDTATEQEQEQQSDRTKPTTSSTNTILNPTQPWIIHGVLALRSLRTLTLAIDDSSVSRAEKIAFCAALSALLNEPDRRCYRESTLGAGGWGETREVCVVFEEEIDAVGRDARTHDAFRWYGGEPGDVVGWGGGDADGDGDGGS